MQRNASSARLLLPDITHPPLYDGQGTHTIEQNEREYVWLGPQEAVVAAL